MTGFSLPDMYRMHYTQPIEQAALEATVEIVELEAWLEDDLECEGQSHPAQIYGHADSAAEYRVAFGCGHVYLMCAGWVHARFSYVLTRCTACGSLSAPEALSVVPI